MEVVRLWLPWVLGFFSFLIPDSSDNSSKVSREGTSGVRESFDLLDLAFNYTSNLSYLCNTDTLMSVLRLSVWL